VCALSEVRQSEGDRVEFKNSRSPRLPEFWTGLQIQKGLGVDGKPGVAEEWKWLGAPYNSLKHHWSIGVAGSNPASVTLLDKSIYMYQWYVPCWLEHFDIRVRGDCEVAFMGLCVMLLHQGIDVSLLTLTTHFMNLLTTLTRLHQFHLSCSSWQTENYTVLATPLINTNESTHRWQSDSHSQSFLPSSHYCIHHLHSIKAFVMDR